MNKGFILYECLIMFILVSFICLNVLNLTHKLIIKDQKIRTSINNYVIKKYSIENCNYQCLIEKALSQ
ncbi:MAG: hypothetical protein LBR40_05620 [Bacilli bacterium]|nr:hypothetical protein [Bacilli bacterium]